MRNFSPLWRYALPRGGRAQLGAADTNVVAAFANGALILLDAATGRKERAIPLPHGLKTYPVAPGSPRRFLTLRYRSVPELNAPVQDWLNAPQRLEAWDARKSAPVWSLAATPQTLIGDGKRAIWQERDQSVVCAEQSTGNILWRLSPEAGGEPFALAGGRVYLRTGGYQNIPAQFMRVTDADNGGRLLGVHKYDDSESSLFQTPQLLLGSDALAIVSEAIVGVGLEEYSVRAFDLARDRPVWSKGDLQAGGLAGDTLLCTVTTRRGTAGAYGMDVRTGRPRWHIARSCRFLGGHGALWVALTTPAGRRDSGGREWVIAGIRPSDGKEAWAFPLTRARDILDIRVIGDRLLLMHEEGSAVGPFILEAYRLP